MKVSQLMNRRVVTIDADDELGLAVQVMLWAGIRHLPVLDGEELVGVLSERDVLRFRAMMDQSVALSEPVSRAMTRPPETAHPDELVSEVAVRMAAGRFGCLPVVDGEELVGIVTVTDVLAGEALGGRPALTGGESTTVGEVMARDPAAVAVDDYLLDAAARMNELGVRHLPVVDGDHKVLGILSDRDVRSALGEPTQFYGPEGVPARIQLLRVESAMTPFPVVVTQHTPLSTAVGYFVDWRLGAVPVVDRDLHLVGILSYVDALKLLVPKGGVRAKVG